MESGGIFLVQPNKELVELTETHYESEDLLQTLLADYPQLLAGGQMNRENPRRWLLVQREAGIPSGSSAYDRWSMDHLFLDQEGVPTIVEVKRSSDTRLRREVVGQMLEYAANAVKNWPLDRIRSMFEQTCSALNEDPDERLLALLNNSGVGDGTIEEFWANVERNFQAKRLRMVFVADVIPEELQCIVEFLNEQMKPSEVLAVEVKQYTGQGIQTLVPRVFGQTAEAQVRKQSAAGPRTSESAFLEGLAEEYASALSELLGVRELGIQIVWGTLGCSFRVPIPGRRSPLSIAWVYPPNQPGWAGLTDVSLGYEDWSATTFSPGVLPILSEYLSKIEAIGGASAVTTKGMSAFTFKPVAFALHRAEIVNVLTWCSTQLKQANST